MIGIRDRYAELIALTQIHLLQEYELSDRLMADEDSYVYFKNMALQRQAASRPSAPTPPTILPEVPQRKAEIAPPTPPAPPPKPPLPPAPPAPAQTTAKADIEPKAPPIQATQEAQSPSHRLALSTPSTPPAVLFDDLKTILKEKLPHIQLVDTPPDDAQAKEIANAWAVQHDAPEAAILSFDEPAHHREFLQNISLALRAYGIDAAVIPAAKIEHRSGWSALITSKQLKLVIATAAGIETLPLLKSCCKDTGKAGYRTIGDRPLLLLSDISFYFKEPALKPALWNAIKGLATIKSV